jgi:hypothetical protein
MHFINNVLILAACGSLVSAVPVPADSKSDLLKQKAGYALQSVGQGLGAASKALSWYAGKKSSAPAAPVHHDAPPQLPPHTPLPPLSMRKREAEAEPFFKITSGEVKAGEAGAKVAVKDSRKIAGVLSKGLAVADSATQSLAYSLQSAGHPTHNKRSISDKAHQAVQTVKDHLPKLNANQKKEFKEGAKVAGQVAMTAGPLLFLKN